MKAKVIIENGETTIVLTPENDFEIDIIEKVEFRNNNYNTSVSFSTNTIGSIQSDHKIEINVKHVR